MRDRALREKRSVAHVRRFPEPHLSPTATKALSNRGVPGPRLPPSQRQRKTRSSVSAEPPAPLCRQKSLPNWRSRKMGSGADSPYQGEMARRARGGRERRLWARSVHWSRPRRRNTPTIDAGTLSSPPHPSGLAASHLPPPGGRLKQDGTAKHPNKQKTRRAAQCAAPTEKERRNTPKNFL